MNICLGVWILVCTGHASHTLCFLQLVLSAVTFSAHKLPFLYPSLQSTQFVHIETSVLP